MAETQIYGHHDIQRYLQHEMSEPEMHQFEKALMNDPYLADALEGFTAADTMVTQQHLDSIERSITADRQEGKVVALGVQKKRLPKFAAVAAVVITIVTAGALTYSVMNNRNSTSAGEKMAAAPRTAVEQRDSIFAAEPPLSGLTVQSKKQPGYKQKVSPPVAASKSIKQQGRKQLPFPPPPVVNDTVGNALRPAIAAATARVEERDLESEQSKQAMLASESQALKQMNTAGAEQSTQRVTLSSVMAKNNVRERTTDTGERFNISTKDKGGLSGNTPGYRSDESRIKKSKEANALRVQEDTFSLAEEVVSTLSSRNKTAVTIRADSSVSAVPVPGWKNFQQYFDQQVDTLKSADPMASVKDMVVEFSISAQGRPTDIRLPANLNKAISETITQILLNGPVWKARKKGDRVKIIIGF